MRADKQHYLKKERLRAAFQAIDLDGSGTIDAAELKHLVGAEQDLTQVLAEIGKGVDDVITLEEFEAILVKKSVMSNLRRPPRAGAQRKAGRCLAVPRQLAAVQIVALAAPMVGPSQPATGAAPAIVFIVSVFGVCTLTRSTRDDSSIGFTVIA